MKQSRTKEEKKSLFSSNEPVHLALGKDHLHPEWNNPPAPTNNNSLLTDFGLSSDVEVFVTNHRPSMQVGDETCEGVCATCACSDRASTSHATALLVGSLPPFIPFPTNI